MKERPILFSGEMVRAILEGRKTQTRRVVRGRWALDFLQPGGFSPRYVALPENYLSPYGYSGDLLWVKETFSYVSIGHAITNQIIYKATDDFSGPWRPSIFMPRWASRITLKITGVRVEKLQEILVQNILSEGVPPIICDEDASEMYEAFADLWDSINAKRGYSWDSNPWVWVIEFEMVKES